MRAYLALVLLALAGSARSAYRLQERFAWRSMDYAYPDDFSRQQALLSRQFVPENNLPVGIEVWGNKLFVSVPRWREGENFNLFCQ